MTNGALDPGVLAELKDTMGADFAGELLDTFLEEAPRMIADLRATAELADADGFRRAAHSMKSNASTFGALALAERARNLEMNGINPQLEQDLAQLETDFAEAQAALRALLNG